MQPNQPQQPIGQPPEGDENIFLTKVAPPPTAEEKKKAATLVTVGLIIGFAILVVGVFMALFLAASGAANSYKRDTLAHTAKLVETIKSIDIDSILNQRDISGSIRTVEQMEQTRPRLPTILFANTMSASYQSSRELQKQFDAYYHEVTLFTRELPGLLTFAQATEETQDDLRVLTEGKAITTPNLAQTTAGSIEDLSARIKELDVPDALQGPRDDLSGAYRELAEGYRDLASAYDDAASSKAQANRRIGNAQRLIEKRSDSSGFATKVKQDVSQFVDKAKVLTDRL